MKAYSKGVSAERELLHFLNYRGFAVTRVPSSGGYLSPIDIIAIKKGLIIAIESKAYSKKPKLEKRKLQRFRDWCERAGALGFLAWRTKNRWLFLRLQDAYDGEYDDENWIELENLLSVLDVG